MKYLELIAPCHFGLEAVLKREILDLGYEISSVEDGKVTLKGDGNLRSTEECDISKVAGKVTEILPPGRSVDPSAAKQQARWRRWISAPYLCRRVWLAVLHRTIAKKYRI